jgi:hypothetical protein
MPDQLYELIKTVGAPTAIALLLILTTNKRLDRINETLSSLPLQLLAVIETLTGQPRRPKGEATHDP